MRSAWVRSSGRSFCFAPHKVFRRPHAPPEDFKRALQRESEVCAPRDTVCRNPVFCCTHTAAGVSHTMSRRLSLPQRCPQQQVALGVGVGKPWCIFFFFNLCFFRQKSPPTLLKSRQLTNPPDLHLQESKNNFSSK